MYPLLQPFNVRDIIENIEEKKGKKVYIDYISLLFSLDKVIDPELAMSWFKVRNCC